MEKKTLQRMDTTTLWTQYVATRDSAIRDELVMRSLRLVEYAVGRVRVCCPPETERDDLVQAGILGLIQAVERFDPSLGFSFQTYAAKRIRGAIIDELRRQDWMSRSARQKRTALQKAYATGDLSDSPEAGYGNVIRSLFPKSPGMGMAASNVPIAAILHWDACMEEPASSRDHDDSLDPAVQAEQAEELDIVQSFLTALPRTERRVLVLYYLEGLMIKEIAAVLGVSPSYISRVHNRAIALLRDRVKLGQLAAAG